MERNKLREYIDFLQSRGSYFFTKEEVAKELKLTPIAIARALHRLIAKGSISHVRKGGFYVIVPPEYRASGILPPEWFIHDLMNALDQPYYVALLSASSLHGAAHQQPQVFHIVSTRQARDIMVKGLRIRFFYKSYMLETPTQSIKTTTGFINVSTPAATAMDLIRFERRIGGLDRGLDILVELQEAIGSSDLLNTIDHEHSLSVIQKLGYLMEMAGNDELAAILEEHIKSRNPQYIALNIKYPRKGFPYNKKWRIIENEDVKGEI